uniref:DUF3778 domain-containing protein n=1 Tax=Oryza meridionalis TaxID=40149 RepID=A0A0E0EIV2_9ORYZ
MRGHADLSFVLNLYGMAPLCAGARGSARPYVASTPPTKTCSRFLGDRAWGLLNIEVLYSDVLVIITSQETKGLTGTGALR